MLWTTTYNFSYLLLECLHNVMIFWSNFGVSIPLFLFGASIQEIDRCIDVNVKGCIWVVRGKSFTIYLIFACRSNNSLYTFIIIILFKEKGFAQFDSCL